MRLDWSITEYQRGFQVVPLVAATLVISFHSRDIVHGLRGRIHVTSGFTADILRVPTDGYES